MNIGIARTAFFMAALGSVMVSAGCRALPWRSNRPTTSAITAEQYAQQAVENIRYDSSIDFSQDYQPNASPSPNYTTPPKSSSAASLSSSGSCCSH